MSVVETLLIYVGAPAALYAGIWVLAGVRRRGGRTRYTAGDPWPYEPLFWIANPAGAAHSAHAGHEGGSEARGGTGGKW